MENSSTYDYPHKKFSALKRKRSQDEDTEDDVIFVSELPAKRAFFRPWLDEPRPIVTLTADQQPLKKSSEPRLTVIEASDELQSTKKSKCTPAASTYKPRLQSPRAQQRRERNTLACLKSRRARQAKHKAMELEYKQFQQQHEANLQQQIRLSLYYVKALQQTMAATREPLEMGTPKRQESRTQHPTTMKP